MDRDGVRVKRMKKQTSTHYFSAFTQVSLIPRGIPTRVFLVIFFELLKKKISWRCFYFFPFQKYDFFSPASFLSLSLRVRLKKGFSFLRKQGKRKDTSLSPVWVRCLKWRSRELFIATHMTASGGSFSHLVCLSFSRNRFSQTPTLLLVQNSLSWRKTISKNMKPPKHTAGFFFSFLLSFFFF